MRILFLALVLVGTSIPKFPLVGAESGVEHTPPFQDIADHSICTLPSETGRCRARKLRYFYNQKTCACETFIYGGCGGNGNNFQSMEACMNACPQEGDICGTKDEEDVCSLPSETGRCFAHMKRYFFNKDTCACEEFIYGGCGGNGNNFEFIEDCQKACPQEGGVCGTKDEEDVCSLPSETGRCFAHMKRYFFNKDTCACEEFIYGGCGGNGNNFDFIEDCQKACPQEGGVCGTKDEEDVCSLPSETGRCFAHMKRYFFNKFNKDTCACEEFIYGGCGGNGNNFDFIEDCQKACPQEGGVCGTKDEEDVCSLPSETGQCFALMKRYFFNKDTCACEEFIYGGCGGNGNNFDFIEDCQKACPQEGGVCGTKDEEDVCSLPSETGRCRARKLRYFYNQKTCACEEFIYGGCGGNGNNFQSMEACMNACPQEGGICGTKDEEDVCSLPSETGPCKALMKRYFFNKDTCACEEFNYGGCKGNGNNFDFIEDCQKACPQEGDVCGPKDEEDVCSLPPDKGPCEAHMKRYFFNKDTCACEEFYYGGCKGNGNNFDLMEDCRKTCPQEGDTCQTSKCEETGTDCPALRCACTLCPDGETEWGCCSKCYQNPEECSGFTPESVCSKSLGAGDVCGFKHKGDCKRHRSSIPRCRPCPNDPNKNYGNCDGRCYLTRRGKCRRRKPKFTCFA